MEGYTIIIRQEPLRGRMCGFTNLPDRRMIDPPLVVQLSIKLKESFKKEKGEKELGCYFSHLANRFLCHVTLSEPTTFEPRNNLKRLKWTPSSKGGNGKKEKTSADSIVPIMFGATCQNGFAMNDMGSEEKSIFFVFPDLSVRIQGDFRVCINVIDLENPFQQSPPLYTNPFKVYSPKQFPGMLVSSDLSRYLFQKGISIRRREYNFSEPESSQNASLPSSTSIKIINTAAKDHDTKSFQVSDPSTPNEYELEAEIDDYSSDETMLNRKLVDTPKHSSVAIAATDTPL